MAINEEDVKKIAKLARLKLSPEELARTQVQLIKILDSMAELSLLDTSAVVATTSVLGLTNVMREDVSEVFGNGEGLLANAPQREGPYFRVKKVIE